MVYQMLIPRWFTGMYFQVRSPESDLYFQSCCRLIVFMQLSKGRRLGERATECCEHCQSFKKRDNSINRNAVMECTQYMLTTKHLHPSVYSTPIQPTRLIFRSIGGWLTRWGLLYRVSWCTFLYVGTYIGSRLSDIHKVARKHSAIPVVTQTPPFDDTK